MAEETITIGCRVPNGYVLEVGLQTTVKGGPHNGLIPQLRRLESYRRTVLKGTHAHHDSARASGILMPAQGNPQPYLNKKVPKVVWDQWLKEHPNSAMVTTGLLFVAKGNETEQQVAAIDAMAAPGAMLPLDPTKPVTVGSDKVTKADFG